MQQARILFHLLDSKARMRFFVLLCLTTLSGFVEILSVGLIIPFIAVANKSLPFGRANLLTQGLLDWAKRMGFQDHDSTAVLGAVFLLGVGLANLYICAYQYYAARVVNQQRCDFSVRVARIISTQSFEWLDCQNSSDLTKIALTDVDRCCALINAVTQVAAIVTRCVVVYAFFLITQARLAIALAISLFIFYQIVFRFIQQPIIRAGGKAQVAGAKLFRAASELIGGAREARATTTEMRFYNRFVSASQQTVGPQVIRAMPPFLTRAGLETVTVMVVIGLLIHFNRKDGDLANGLPLLSSYAVAGIRLLPALQQALNWVLEIKYLAPSLNDLAQVLKMETQLVPPGSTAPIKMSQALELHNVTYSYSADCPVIRNVNLKILKNTRVAFVGETGAGKSTLIDIILALRLPQSGHLLVDGLPIDSQNASAWRQDIGYVPQSIYLLDASIAENVAFGYEPAEIKSQNLERALKSASLTTFLERLPEGSQTFVGERGVRLSGGQCQRIGIARALYNDPDVVVFDEATSSLDALTENSVLEALDGLKGAKTLIVIAHRLNTVWDFDQIFVLDQGELVGQGTSTELLESCPVFERLAKHQMNLTGERSGQRTPYAVAESLS